MSDESDTGMSNFGEDGVERRQLRDYAEKAYLDYSMYVINDRALPHVGDGLKPVQRRIIFAMAELGLDSTAKYSKSARTVGDVLGKFHPHGDSACYEAMVLMAQDFSFRYPLVDGQGNWGAQDDPKSFAAMRYTEARLAPIADVLLAELRQGTVDFSLNFDGALEEPTVLPARLPTILLNGGTGIAVGMATDIPPHNIREVVSAAIRLLDAPRSTLADLLEHIQGPDFPTEAQIITPAADIAKMYEEGRGSIRARAVYDMENGDIVISALPHQSSPTKVMEQIAQQMRERKLPMIVGLRDEGDQDSPTRIVLEPRSNRIDVKRTMSHLFATTDLEKSFRVNLNMIGLDGRPRVKNLKELLAEWLSFRTTTVRRRLQFRLDKVNDRLHVLGGLLIAYLNIDEVIRIIREEDKPRDELMRRYDLSERQANAILDIRLRQLAKLEEIELRKEQDELSAEGADIERTLGSERRLKTLIRKELLADAETYGDERRSQLVADVEEAKALTEEDLLSNDPLTVVLSQKGWVRAGKGHELDATTLSYRSGDALQTTAQGRSNELCVFIDSTGRSYSVAPHTLPSARSQGEPLSGRLNPPSGATFAGVMMGTGDQRIVLASSAGYGFVVALKELVTKNRAGKAALTVPAGSAVVAPQPLHRPLEELELAAFTSQGRLLVFPVTELPELRRGKGNKILSIPTADWQTGEEVMIAAVPFARNEVIVVHAGQRYLRLKSGELDAYRGERARRGRKLPRGFQKVDRVALAQ